MPRSFHHTLAFLGALGALTVSSPASAFEHRHALAGGYQFGHVRAKSGGRYHLRSLPISYVGRYGSEWAAMLRTSFLVPLRASDGDEAFRPGAEYDSTQAFDMVAGASLRFSRIKKWDIDAGFGPHLNYTRFQSTKYVEWSSAALGIGVGASARRKFAAGWWNGYPEIGVHLDASYDAIDLSHGGDLGSGIQGHLSVSLGWAMGDRR